MELVKLGYLPQEHQVFDRLEEVSRLIAGLQKSVSRASRPSIT